MPLHLGVHVGSYRVLPVWEPTCGLHFAVDYDIADDSYTSLLSATTRRSSLVVGRIGTVE